MSKNPPDLTLTSFYDEFERRLEGQRAFFHLLESLCFEIPDNAQITLRAGDLASISRAMGEGMDAVFKDMSSKAYR